MRVMIFKKNARSKKINYEYEKDIELVYKARHEEPNEDEFLKRRICLRLGLTEKQDLHIKECKLIKILGIENQPETLTLKKLI
jgi:hypothetical protein